MAENSLRARIDAVAQAEPALADAFALRGALIEIMDHADISSPELRLPGEYVRARIAAGTPLLDGIDLPVPAAASVLFERLTVSLLADPSAREAAEVLLTATRRHRLHAEQVVGEAVVSHSDHLAALAEDAGVSAAVLEMVADLTARPLLMSVATRLRPALKLATWARGWCPICGAHPIFAEGDEHASLRCGRCTTTWAWSLPKCPTCQDGGLTEIASEAIAGAGDWSLLGCDACHTYLKLARSARTENLGMVLVDDLVTWSLDRAALTTGYQRPNDAGRRLEHGDPGGEDDDDD